MRIFIDIETIPDQTPGALAAIQASIKPPGNYSKPDTIAKWLAENAATEADRQWRKTAFSGTHGEIVVIGFALGDGDVEMLHRERDSGDEHALLAVFWDTLLERIQARNGHPAGVEWCGHNVAFDLRFLKQRSIVHDITPTVRVNPDARHAAGHLFDTMQEWAGIRETISLDALCRVLGVASPKAGGMDGSKVIDLWQGGRMAEAVAYCRGDVEAVRQCYRRLMFAEAA